MTIQSDITNFGIQTRNRLEQRKTHLKLEADSAIHPFLSSEFHQKATLHIVNHLEALLHDCCALIEGLGYLYNVPEESYRNNFYRKSAGKSCLEQLGVIALDIINCIGSILTLITRSIATLFNMGYAADTTVSHMERLGESFSLNHCFSLFQSACSTGAAFVYDVALNQSMESILNSSRLSH